MKYEFVNVRFNMDKLEESTLFSKLNPKNRGGNIKEILKQFFLLEDESFMKKAELKSIIKEVIDNENDTKEEEKIVKRINTGGIKITLNGKEKPL